MSNASTPQPREWPILFSGQMVRAIIQGRKTQTRRIVPEWTFARCARQTGVSCDLVNHELVTGLDKVHEDWLLNACPYGAAGDTLWVRETWNVPPGSTEFAEVAYAADGHHDATATWRPSIHMPRSFARLLLRVTGVRMERVQAISDDDVRAEGAIANRGDGETWYHGKSQAIFRELWDSINGVRSPWDDNPWVWVVSFERTDGGR